MHNGLAAILAAIIHDAIAVLQAEFFCDLRNDRKDMGNDITIRLIDLIRAGDMLLRDEQNMFARLRASAGHYAVAPISESHC